MEREETIAKFQRYTKMSREQAVYMLRKRHGKFPNLIVFDPSRFRDFMPLMETTRVRSEDAYTEWHNKFKAEMNVWLEWYRRIKDRTSDYQDLEEDLADSLGFFSTSIDEMYVRVFDRLLSPAAFDEKRELWYDLLVLRHLAEKQQAELAFAQQTNDRMFLAWKRFRDMNHKFRTTNYPVGERNFRIPYRRSNGFRVSW